MAGYAVAILVTACNVALSFMPTTSLPGQIKNALIQWSLVLAVVFLVCLHKAVRLLRTKLSHATDEAKPEALAELGSLCLDDLDRLKRDALAFMYLYKLRTMGRPPMRGEITMLANRAITLRSERNPAERMVLGQRFARDVGLMIAGLPSTSADFQDTKEDHAEHQNS